MDNRKLVIACYDKDGSDFPRVSISVEPVKLAEVAELIGVTADQADEAGYNVTPTMAKKLQEYLLSIIDLDRMEIQVATYG